jgi:hypothetical protein
MHILLLHSSEHIVAGGSPKNYSTACGETWHQRVWALSRRSSHRDGVLREMIVDSRIVLAMKEAILLDNLIEQTGGGGVSFGFGTEWSPVVQVWLNFPQKSCPRKVLDAVNEVIRSLAQMEKEDCKLEPVDLETFTQLISQEGVDVTSQKTSFSSSASMKIECAIRKTMIKTPRRLRCTLEDRALLSFKGNDDVDETLVCRRKKCMAHDENIQLFCPLDREHQTDHGFPLMFFHDSRVGVCALVAGVSSFGTEGLKHGVVELCDKVFRGCFFSGVVKVVRWGKWRGPCSFMVHEDKMWVTRKRRMHDL